MNKFIKIIFCLISFSLNAQFNEEIDNIQHNIFDGNLNESELFYEENNSGGTSPITPPDDDEFAPINDYLPLLAVAAVGLGFYYRKELNQTIKSN